MKSFTKLITLLLSVQLLSFCTQNSTETGQSGGKKILKLNLGTEPASLHPITSSELVSSIVQGYILDNLLVKDLDSYEWVPALAEKYEILDDGMTFKFTLRKGVKWHDGQPLTAHDFKASFDAQFDDVYNSLSSRPYLSLMNSPEIIDDYTFVVKAKEKYFGNFQYLNGIVQLIPKHIYGNSKEGKKVNFTLIGSGPFKLKTFERGKKIILERNPEWWGWSEKYFKDMYGYDEIHFSFIKEDAVAMEHFKKEQLHHLEMTAEDFVVRAEGPKWGKELLKVKASNLAPKGQSVLIWNMRQPLFQDKNLRQALTHLMNRELMNEKFRYNMSSLATGPWYPQSDYSSKNVKPLLYDPKKAGELLKASGWSDTDDNGVLDKVINGKKTELKITINNASPDTMKYFTMYKEDAAKAGVQIEINQVEWNTLVKLIDELNFEAIALGWGAGAIDHDPKQLWHCDSTAKGGSNIGGYCNKEVDALIEKGRLTLDRDERIKVYNKIYETIAEDQPNLFMFSANYALYGVNHKVNRPKDTYKYAVGEQHWSLQAE